MSTLKFDNWEAGAAALSALGLPPIFLKIWHGEEPQSLRWHLAAPRRFFADRRALIACCPRLASSLPLLEFNGDHCLGFDSERGEYFEYYYGDQQCEVIGSDYQQLLSWLFVDFGYAGLDDIVEELAGEFRYKYLLSFLEFMDDESEDDPREAKRLFVRATTDKMV